MYVYIVQFLLSQKSSVEYIVIPIWSFRLLILIAAMPTAKLSCFYHRAPSSAMFSALSLVLLVLALF